MSLYRKDPVMHAYLLYDLVYELENTEAWFNLGEDGVVGYVLVWRGPRANGIHVWGQAEQLLDNIPVDRRAIVQVHNTRLVREITARLSEFGSVEVSKFATMYVDRRCFNPWKGEEEAVRLSPDDPLHVRQLAEVKWLRGIDVTLGEVRELLERGTYYGLFIGDVLASTACIYLRTRDVWAVGDVYTRPEYRGRGFAKIVTSAATRTAIDAGARAILHVESTNEPAIRVYKALGYRRVALIDWIKYSPGRR